MAFVFEIEAAASAGVFQWCSESTPQSVVDGVSLAEFRKDCVSNTVGSGRLDLLIKQFVRLWIDGNLQPELLVVGLDHGFVNCNVIRVLSMGGL